MKASQPYENRTQPLVSFSDPGAYNPPQTASLSSPLSANQLLCDTGYQPPCVMTALEHPVLLFMQVPALAGKGAPDPDTMAADIPMNELPHDEDGNLLRPGVVWWVLPMQMPTLSLLQMHAQHRHAQSHKHVICHHALATCSPPYGWL